MKRSSSDVADEACEIRDTASLVSDGTDKSAKRHGLTSKRLKSAYLKGTDEQAQLELQRQINQLRVGGVTDEEIALLRARWRDNSPSTPMGQTPWDRHAFGTRDGMPVPMASNGILPITNNVIDRLGHQVGGYVMRRPSPLENQMGRSQQLLDDDYRRFLQAKATSAANTIPGDLPTFLAGRAASGSSLRSFNREIDGARVNDPRFLSLLQSRAQPRHASASAQDPMFLPHYLDAAGQRQTQRLSLLAGAASPSPYRPDSSLLRQPMASAHQQWLRHQLLADAAGDTSGAYGLGSSCRSAGDDEATAAALRNSVPSLAHQRAMLRSQIHDPGVLATSLQDSSLSGASTSSVVLYMPSDEEFLSRFQCLARKQIELFEATNEDVEAGARGRNKPIVLGQVGIRCIHCRNCPLQLRTKGAVYFPTKFDRVYQTAVNMAAMHLCTLCRHIPKPIQNELRRLKDEKLTFGVFGGGKTYWASRVRMLGVTETEDDGLRFSTRSS